MANAKISQLPSATTPLAGSELVEIVQGGINKQVTAQDVADLSGGVSNWGDIGGTLSDQTDLQAALDAKQATLVSGTNIKTVNGTSIVGSGDIDVVDDAIVDNVTTKAPSQNAVFDALELKKNLINSATSLTDGSTIDLTAIKHTLSSSSSTRTFTISYTGDDITVEVTLSTTSATYTFPSGSLCVSEGFATGDNTCPLTGASGDKYIIAIKKVGSNYYVVSKNFGQ